VGYQSVRGYSDYLNRILELFATVGERDKENGRYIEETS